MNRYQNELVEKINQLHADLDGFNGLEYLDICGDQINSAIDEYNKFHKEDQSVHNDFDFTINNDEYISLIRERLGSSNFQYHVERLLAFDEKVFPNLKDSFLQTFESDIIKLIQEDVLEKVKMVTISSDIYLKQVIFRFTYFDKSHPDLEETPGYLFWLQDNIIKETNELTEMNEEYPNFDPDLTGMFGIDFVYHTWIYPLLVAHLKLSVIKVFQSPSMQLILSKYSIKANVEIFMIENELPVIKLK